MSHHQRRSHFDYQPHRPAEGEPDGAETAKLLPQAPRERLLKLFEDGTLRPGELDHKSVLSLHALSEPLQLKVIEHMEIERLFLTNSRSKAGFLVSACEKAKRGELDVRGFGALDPWRTSLKADCIPRYEVSLLGEQEWIQKLGVDSIELQISNEAACATMRCNLTDCLSNVKNQYYSSLDSPNFPLSRLRLSHVRYGALRDIRTLAYYNLADADCLVVKVKMRGGRKVNRQL